MLVITIIVLLILSGVTITVISGDNGIISKSQNMTNSTKRNQIITSVGVDILSAELEADLTQSKLEEILDQYGDVQFDDEGDITGLLPDDLDEVIDIADLYTGDLIKTISTTESFVGCYADLDPTDGKIDGVIFVDLMQKQSADYWFSSTDGTYSWTVLTESDGVKDYYVSQESYTDDFGTAKVISPVNGSTGKKRFYVMALDDASSGYHSWYYSASSYGMSDYADATSGDLGSGYKNTETMISYWTNQKYGTQNGSSYHTDMWGLDTVQTGYAGGWFVPSIGEWCAFVQELGITISDYGKLGFGGDAYWSSSQCDATYSYALNWETFVLFKSQPIENYAVRLSTTF